ncbi:hypothetical protein B9T33_13145 [Acinetobacter sp. ANC 5054]|uniref:hypothetical protein n=1 Tax=Acinetobacter sp. ANC 5054 TaxID=1977877 RepID=UPI000A34F61B|nr:hypothetical protein [Acinetobacter sp. ANC 5054]OTG79136.1 hypothetical protein B9T33_13145 [Acinetobacter sp. ANC 5054]
MISFGKNLYWKKGEGFKNVTEVFEKNLINESDFLKYDAINFTKTLKNHKILLNRIGVSFDLSSVKKPEDLTKTRNLTWGELSSDGVEERGKFILQPLINYPTINVELKDKEFENGFINTDTLQPRRTFVFENINNFGVNYTF